MDRDRAVREKEKEDSPKETVIGTDSPVLPSAIGDHNGMLLEQMCAWSRRGLVPLGSLICVYECTHLVVDSK